MFLFNLDLSESGTMPFKTIVLGLISFALSFLLLQHILSDPKLEGLLLRALVISAIIMWVEHLGQRRRKKSKLSDRSDAS